MASIRSTPLPARASLRERAVDRVSLRLLAAGLALAAGLLLSLGLGAADAEAAQCKRASVAAHQLAGKVARRATLCLINRQRAQRSMPRLREHRAKRQAASRHTRKMIKTRCFAHQCPGEKPLLGRIMDTAYLPCACSWSIAENIAWGSRNAASPRRIVRAWMRSPGHRVNILNRSFQHIGIGIGKGTPGGTAAGATYTTTFGSKR